VVIEPKIEESDEDPVMAKFLEFLERDIANNPQYLAPIEDSLMRDVDELIKGVEIDMDAPLDDE
jgi:antitoxin PrlF